MTTTESTPTVRSRSRQPGPPLSVPAVAFAVLFIAGIATGPIVGTGVVPSPFGDGAASQAYFADNQQASRIAGLLLFVAALGLAVFTAVAGSRLAFLAPNVPGPTIAAAGGLLASVFLGASGLIQSTLGRPEIADQPDLVRGLHHLQFVTGGPGHTACLGVLTLGIAIHLLHLRLLPRWLLMAGIVVAALALLSSLVLVNDSLIPLIPLGRFPAMIWLLAMSFVIPRGRTRRGTVQPG